MEDFSKQVLRYFYAVKCGEATDEDALELGLLQTQVGLRLTMAAERHPKWAGLANEAALYRDADLARAARRLAAASTPDATHLAMEMGAVVGLAGAIARAEEGDSEKVEDLKDPKRHERSSNPRFRLFLQGSLSDDDITRMLSSFEEP